MDTSTTHMQRQRPGQRHSSACTDSSINSIALFLIQCTRQRRATINSGRERPFKRCKLTSQRRRYNRGENSYTRTVNIQIPFLGPAHFLHCILKLMLLCLQRSRHVFLCFVHQLHAFLSPLFLVLSLHVISDSCAACYHQQQKTNDKASNRTRIKASRHTLSTVGPLKPWVAFASPGCVATAVPETLC